MRYLFAASALSFLFFASTASAATLTVGPNGMYPAPCAAFAKAAAGDTIEIDAAGTYSGDVCSIKVDNLTIKGVGGRPKIDAAGKVQMVNGKAIWVITANNTLIENVELSGATVEDQNGAGIRQEGKNLTVRNTYFHDNEDGILAGDNDGSTIIVEGCEFANNGFGDGYSHNLYINHVDKLVFQYNYSHDCKEGHLLKSRARENYVLYNRLTEQGGSGSYEIDLPSGGKSYIIGNLVQQGPSSNNPSLVAYGEEPNGINPILELFVVNNTFVNEKANGTFLNIGGGVSTPVVVTNNIFRGPGTVISQGNAMLKGNFTDMDGDPMFVNQGGFDYHLQDASPCKDKGVDPGSGSGMSLAPTEQYVHPSSHEGRMAVGAIDIGAYEIGGGVGGSSGSGGAGGSSAGGSSPGGSDTGGSSAGGSSAGGSSPGGSNAGGTDAGSAGDGGGGDGGSSGGCDCRTSSDAGSGGAAAGLLMGLSLLARRRAAAPSRRRRRAA
jgi:hypothetical protein